MPYGIHQSKFLDVTVPILVDVVEKNPDYRMIVGRSIFTFVKLLVQFNSPRATGLLIDLPIPEIREYMQNYDIFVERVKETKEILNQSIII